MNHLRRDAAIWTAVVIVIATALVVYRLEEPVRLGALEWLKIAEGVVAIDSVLFGLFAALGWRWRALRGWLVVVPDLTGSWSGEIVPVLRDADGRVTKADPIPSTLKIRQTLGAVSCRVETGEMASRSYAGDFICDEASGERSLVYCYGTDPILSRREQNPRHDGAVVLAIRENGQMLVGRYWTDRLTRGELTYRHD
jgi:hypothetical protein